MKEFLNQPELEKYTRTYNPGDYLFRENDDSQDLYILVSGHLDVFKGDNSISDLSEPGTMLGEMSFLLRSKRTATIVARDTVTVIRIPSEEVTNFLEEFPAIAQKITSMLARRLNETTNVMHGLKEFCDQLPDAVIMTDKNQKILAWNTAAERLYGRSWTQMRSRSIDEIYDNQGVYKQFMAELAATKSVKEKILKINHPIEHWKFVSISTTVLLDGNHDTRGYLFIGRDVTKTHTMSQKQKKVVNFLLPIALLIIIPLVFQLWKNYLHQPEIISTQAEQIGFQSRITRDYLGLSLLLSNPLIEGDRSRSTALMEEYFALHDPGRFAITGILLLDKDNRIVNIYSKEIGSSPFALRDTEYAGVKFKSTTDQEERCATVFLISRNQVGGNEGVDLAFDLEKENEDIGRLIFQLDMKILQEEYHINVNDLAAIRY
ncbi:MAG: cyclic nucleotide-binding domain-containing protein [Proteobacteria bacterium]|nr:cyclic nucleotide-binding domain-containing protein [Pseudomonadota bacterium]